MWRFDAALSKTILLLAGMLLWGGGAQAETSLKSLSEVEGVTCKKGDLRSCLIYYYLVKPDPKGELKDLSDDVTDSPLSPRLKKVQVLLEEKKLGGRLHEELQQLYASADASEEKKKAVAQRWAAFAFMLKRLDPTSVGADTVFGYAQDDVSLKSTFRDIDEQLDSSVSKESNLRELIIRWTNFMLPIAATMAALGLVWAGFLYITSFQDESRLEEAKEGDSDGRGGGGAGWGVVCDCEYDCESGVLIFGRRNVILEMNHRWTQIDECWSF